MLIIKNYIFIYYLFINFYLQLDDLNINKNINKNKNFYASFKKYVYVFY